METITVELEISKSVSVDVRIDEVIDAINELEIKRRWNYIGQILNEVELSLIDLTESQKKICKDFLTRKLSLFPKELNKQK